MSSPIDALGFLVGVADVPHAVFIKGEGAEPPVLFLPQGDPLPTRRRLLAEWLVKNG